MPIALVLIDLQADFLAAPGLHPPPGELVERAACLLEGWRARGAPVVHVWTTVRREDDRRMPHWRAAGTWRCEAGTPGHATPPALAPRDAEPVVHKTDFSGFGATTLDEALAACGADGVVLCGTHLHACVRATALDAYRRRLAVTLAQDAIGSDDPLHAAATRAWLAPRGVAFRTVDALLALPRTSGGPRPAPRLPGLVAAHGEDDGDGRRLLAHELPARTGELAWEVAAGDARAVDHVVAAAADAAPGWEAAGGPARIAVLGRLARAIAADAEALAAAIVADVGKPVTQAREEVQRTVALIDATCARGDDRTTTACGPSSVREERPLGTVALVTPWNNPLAIPVGKLAPALAYGNTVAWKPSPAGTRIALEVLRLARAAGLPAGALSLVAGDEQTATLLMAHPRVDAVTVTGGAGLGWTAAAACARRGVPLQAELGGNNATLVAADADLAAAAPPIAAGAFAYAGQRCTAGRRVIVERAVLEPFCAALLEATADLAWGRPDDPATVVGPLIGTTARRRVRAAVARAAGDAVLLGDGRNPRPELEAEGAYLAPIVLRCATPGAEIVREETFGPVLVVQPAEDWTQAIRLADGVRHGLVAAAFTTSPAREEAFLRGVRAGVLKVGLSTAGADVEAPFGGWKQSGSGPPEHGVDDRSFFTRPRAVYRAAG